MLEKLKKATKESYQETLQSLQKNKTLQILSLMLGIFGLSGLTAFADSPSTTTAVITAEMLKPIVGIITSNIAVILPVGITIMGAIIGVGMIPRIIYKFL